MFIPAFLFVESVFWAQLSNYSILACTLLTDKWFIKMSMKFNIQIVTGCLPISFLTEQVWSAFILSSSPISNQANEFDQYYDPC